jgi:glycosyltransferase involved in cell wall biosynthesis
MTARVTLLLPCRNEEHHIVRCIDSLLATSYPLDHLELLVIDGESDDATRDMVASYTKTYPWIRVLDNPARIVPAALNMGIRAAVGDVIMRVDAHALYPPTYIPRLVAALGETGADNVGGYVITLPADASAEARAIAIALSHPFGVGNSYFRIGGGPRPRWVDTVPYGCWPREIFQRVGLFDEELVRDQDEEFNYRILKAGGRILLLPDVVSHYFARARRGTAARMLYQYGYYKPLVARKVGRVVTARQLAPPVFVLALALGALLGPVVPSIGSLWVAMLITYATAAIAGAAGMVREHGVHAAGQLGITFPVLHVAYGTGFLVGLWRAFTGHTRWRDASAVPLTR